MKIKGTVNSAVLVALIFGVIVIAGGENLSRILGLGERGGTVIVVIGFFIMGVLIGFVAPPSTAVPVLVLFALGAIAVGDLVDVCIDWFLRARDRNLWPLEVIVLWVLSLLPLFLGIKLIRRLKTST